MKRRAAGALTLAVLLGGCASGSGGAAKGTGLYAAAQATAGESAYRANCAMCHGVRLEGGAAPPLAGEPLRPIVRDAHTRVGDMFATVARQMPLNRPGSLTDAQYVEIMAYILAQNGYPAGQAALTFDGALRSREPLVPGVPE